MRFTSGRADTAGQIDKYLVSFCSSSCYSDKKKQKNFSLSKRRSFKRNRTKIEPLRFPRLRFPQHWLWLRLRFSIVTESKGPFTRNTNWLWSSGKIARTRCHWLWLVNWREFFKPITERSNRDRLITFYSHLKIALFYNFCFLFCKTTRQEKAFIIYQGKLNASNQTAVTWK